MGIPLSSLKGEGAHLIDVDLAYTSIARPLGNLGSPHEEGLTRLLCPLGPICLTVVVILERFGAVLPLLPPMPKVKPLPQWLAD